MKRYLILFTIAMLVPFLMQSQDLVDALRYSNTMVQGTARSGAMGNAFGALGGDFTSVSINPAGVAMYRSGEFSITPKSSNTNSEGMYLGTTVDDNNYKFILNNISYVSAIPTGNRNEAGIISVNIGIGYNRLKDFNENSYFQGSNLNASYMDYFADNANAGLWSDYYEELAWQTDMLLYDENNNEYWHDMQDAGYGQTQRKTYSRSGSIDEYSLSMGLNFNHKVYVGASWSISDLYYRESITVSEWDANNNVPYFDEFDFNTFLRTSGYGNSFKFGLIYKPVNNLRLGVALHTPTFYKVHDSFSTSMQSTITYDDGTERYDEGSPYSEYDYRIETPMRTTFSGAYVIGKKGLISVDYELINYANAKLRRGGDGYDFVDENMDIAEAYKTTGNLRIGGELRVSEPFSIRAGYQYQPSAFNSVAFGNSQPNADANMMVYSGGIGYRIGAMFFDLAYRYSSLNNFDLPYPIPSESYPAPQMAEFNHVRHDVLFTFGYRF